MYFQSSGNLQSTVGGKTSVTRGWKYGRESEGHTYLALSSAGERETVGCWAVETGEMVLGWGSTIALCRVRKSIPSSQWDRYKQGCRGSKGRWHEGFGRGRQPWEIREEIQHQTQRR